VTALLRQGTGSGAAANGKAPNVPGSA